MEPVSTSSAEDARRVRLLVVDDDDGIRTLLEVSISLDPRFSLVGSAANGGDALDILRNATDGDRPDVVLLDVSLPDVDGIDLVPAVREAAPDTKVALFTGWSDDETIARAQAAGADAVFGKDGDPRRLLDGLGDLTAG